MEAVEPEVNREARYKKLGEQATECVKRYLEGCAIVYDIDERYLLQEVTKKLEAKVRD